MLNWMADLRYGFRACDGAPALRWARFSCLRWASARTPPFSRCDPRCFGVPYEEPSRL